MVNRKEKDRIRLRNLTYGLIVYLTIVLLICQLLVFGWNWSEIGISMLIGTCGTLVGCFSAVLASPYTISDKERLSKVGSTISTLITGYILAKIVDPLINTLTEKETLPLILLPKNGANLLIAIIGFLGGFLFVYQYRVYISGEVLEISTAEQKENTEN